MNPFQTIPTYVYIYIICVYTYIYIVNIFYSFVVVFLLQLKLTFRLFYCNLHLIYQFANLKVFFLSANLIWIFIDPHLFCKASLRTSKSPLRIKVILSMQINMIISKWQFTWCHVDIRCYGTPCYVMLLDSYFNIQEQLKIQCAIFEDLYVIATLSSYILDCTAHLLWYARALHLN